MQNLAAHRQQLSAASVATGVDLSFCEAACRLSPRAAVLMLLQCRDCSRQGVAKQRAASAARRFARAMQQAGCGR